MRELETAKLIKELNVSTVASASTVARRDSAGDISVRLIRQNYQDQNTMSGGLVYRVNNSTDNYLRVCNSPSAIMNWLGAVNRVTSASNSAITIPPSSPSNGILEFNGVSFNVAELGTQNLNDLKASGNSKHYVQSNSSYATTANNYPISQKGILTILSGTNLVVQIYQPTQDSTSSMWTRIYNGSSWTSWSRVYHTGNKPTAAEIGALPTSGGKISGTITKTGSGAGFIISNSTGRTMMYASTTPGEHIFGGNNDSSNSVADFIRIGPGVLQYTTGGRTSQILHSGLTDITIKQTKTMGQSTAQETNIVPSTIMLTNTIEGKRHSGSMGLLNKSLEFYAQDFYFYPSSSIFGVIINGKMSCTEGTFGEMKAGCVIGESLESKMEYGFNMGQKMRLGYIACQNLTQMSDKRTKEEIKYINENEEEIKNNDFYDFFLNDFKPVSFKYIGSPNRNVELGFIAQDIQETKLSKYLLTDNKLQKDDLISFNNYSYTSAIAIALQQALLKIEELQKKVDAITK